MKKQKFLLLTIFLLTLSGSLLFGGKAIIPTATNDTKRQLLTTA